MDGKKDIAVVNYGDAQNFTQNAFVSVYQKSGTGLTFTPPSPGTFDTRSSLPGGQYLAVGDFDGNGTPDVVVAQASNKVGMLTNNTSAATPGG